MLTPIDAIHPHELPRALQQLLGRNQADVAVTLPRRRFLKLAGAGGLALGAFPHLASAQAAAGSESASARAASATAARMRS